VFDFPTGGTQKPGRCRHELRKGTEQRVAQSKASEAGISPAIPLAPSAEQPGVLQKKTKRGPGHTEATARGKFTIDGRKADWVQAGAGETRYGGVSMFETGNR